MNEDDKGKVYIVYRDIIKGLEDIEMITTDPEKAANYCDAMNEISNKCNTYFTTTKKLD